MTSAPMTSGAVPVLSAGFAWVTSEPEGAVRLKAGVVPLLLATDEQRAERWADVLRAYGTVSTFTLERSGALRLVVSVGEADEIGTAAAAVLGRVQRHVPDLRPFLVLTKAVISYVYAESAEVSEEQSCSSS